MNPYRAALQAIYPIADARNIALRISNLEKTISDFAVYLTIDERLTKRMVKQYQYIAIRFLKHSKGIVSRDAIRSYLQGYLSMKPSTYNNQIKGLKAFIMRYLGRPEIVFGFRKAPLLNNYEETVLSSKEQLRLGFSALSGEREKAIFMFYKDSGLKCSELLELAKSDVDSSLRSVKSRHNTRTKRAGITFYTVDTEKYLQKYLASRKDDKERLFRIDKNVFYRMWIEVSRKAGTKITPQVLKKWQSANLGENGCPDRYFDIFQGRAPRPVLAKYYTGRELLRLKSIYDRFSEGLKLLA
ncbi:MAG: integrase [Candidatus Bathyarchaeota archaeon]|nr:integrase [Candidatus Bathyarchaeota archaeon]MDH5495238.1 integrase [Candidatus Bathyarchaeota archaeon]